jgi:hypothetical protein
METGCRHYSFIVDPLMSKILASREGLEAAARLGIQRIIVLTDCSNMANIWQDAKQVRIEGAHVVSEMKELCANGG